MMPEPYPKEIDIAELVQLARTIRMDILESTTRAASGHPSSSWSAVEIMVALYFGGMLRYRPDDPWWPERDRFLMSKGHAAPLLYAILAHAGYFGLEMLDQLRQIGSPMQGHPILGCMPGVECTSGSLGQGLSLGIGHVLAGRLNRQTYRVYVLIGDGECEAGQVWEAAMAAAHFKCDRLTAILDYNGYQETGPISREMGLEPLVDKWKAFGWHVEECDGHSIPDLLTKMTALQAVSGQPQILIAHTVKGKGVSFVEADFTFHGRALTPAQAVEARKELA
jgi:transketolase